MIQKIAILLLLCSSCSNLAQANETDFNSYKVINANTGNELNFETFSEEVEIIKAHLALVLGIKKTLLKNKIDISKVDISLYLEELSTSRNTSWRTNQSNSNSKIISSPWIELTETINKYGETEIELKIDAGYVRLMMDLFPDPENKVVTEKFQEIPVLNSTCFDEIGNAYTNYITGFYRPYGREIFDLVDAFDCAPELLKIPLMSLLISAPKTNLFPKTQSVYQRLDSCLSTAQDYYSDLYPLLALRAFEILDSNSNHKPTWWTEITEQIDSIQICRRKN